MSPLFFENREELLYWLVHKQEGREVLDEAGAHRPILAVQWPDRVELYSYDNVWLRVFTAVDFVQGREVSCQERDECEEKSWAILQDQMSGYLWEMTQGARPHPDWPGKLGVLRQESVSPEEFEEGVFLSGLLRKLEDLAEGNINMAEYVSLWIDKIYDKDNRRFTEELKLDKNGNSSISGKTQGPLNIPTGARLIVQKNIKRPGHPRDPDYQLVVLPPRTGGGGQQQGYQQPAAAASHDDDIPF